jgi:hypothetical protein
MEKKTAVTCHTPLHEGSGRSQLVSTEAASLSESDLPDRDGFTFTYPQPSTDVYHPMAQRFNFAFLEDNLSSDTSTFTNRSKPQLGAIPISLKDREPSWSPPLWKSPTRSRGISRRASPSFSDSRTEFLEAVSPRLSPSILSPSPPSSVLHDFTNNTNLYENIKVPEFDTHFDDDSQSSRKHDERLKISLSLNKITHGTTTRLEASIREKWNDIITTTNFLGHLRYMCSCSSFNDINYSPAVRSFNFTRKFGIMGSDENEQLYMQRLAVLEVQYGRAHPEVIEFVINLAIFQIRNSRPKSAHALLWRTVEAIRGVLDNILSKSLEILDALETSSIGPDIISKGEQMLNSMIDVLSSLFTSSTHNIDSSCQHTLPRLQNLITFIWKLNEVGKAAINCEMYGADRKEVRNPNGLCEVLNEIVNSMTTATLFAEVLSWELKIM